MKTLAAVCAGSILWALPGPAHADLAEVRKRMQLRVVVAEGAPQFFAWKPGAAPGLEREVLQGFCRLQRVDLAIVPVTSTAALFGALARGEADIGAGGHCAVSTETVEYSAEVLPTRYIVVSRKPAGTVLTLDELRERKVGIVKDTSLAATVAFVGVPDASVEVLSGAAALLDALEAGEISAGVLRAEEAIPAQRADPGLLLGLYLGGRVSVAFPMRKEDVQLRAALNEYIGNLRRSPAWNRLVLTYFGDSAADILKASR